MNLEKMYEVLKFVEYGGYCRRSMDCVHGMLLIDRMKNEAVVDKAVLFGWFRKMAVCAEQYERCGEGQNYKYLNPYGIVLSDEGEVLFLDTESRENAEVMKQMQKRAVRSHLSDRYTKWILAAAESLICLDTGIRFVLCWHI